MKDLTPKFNNTAGPTGQLQAEEFNDFANDVQNSILNTGQLLTANVGEDNLQLLKAISSGGSRITRGDTETALIGEIVIPNNLVGNITINLPATGLFIGATIFFEQAINQLYSENPVTIGRGSNNIMGLAEDMIMDSILSDNTKIACVWLAGSTGWKISVIGSIGSTL